MHGQYHQHWFFFILPLSILLFVVLADTVQRTDITTHIAAQFERIRELVDDVAG